MTKQDKRAVVIAVVTSIFIGAVVLGVVLVKNRNKLKPKKLKDLAKEDLAFWNGVIETSSKGAEKISEYWKSLNYNYSTEQLKSSQFQDEHYWSAVYISDFMKRWGAGDRFDYSPSHSTYIVAGKASRNIKDDKIFKTYPTDQAKVEVGDIVAKSRSSQVNYDNLYVGAPTHTDIVYDIKKTSEGYTAHLIGGNLANSVKSSTIHLDKDKMIIHKDNYMAIMKNQDL